MMDEKKRSSSGSGSGSGVGVGSDGGGSLVIEELRNLCVPMDSVKPDPKNPRVNDEAAVKLAELIKAHGFRVPIVIDAQGVIRAGHTRYKAMRILEAREIPAVRQEFLSEAAARAFAIADNKSSEWSEWDDDVLRELLDTPEISKVSGFDEKEIQKLYGLPGAETIEKINEKGSGIKDRIIVLVLDAARKMEVRELLINWIETVGLKDVEVE